MKTPVVIVAVCGALSSVAACGSKEAAPAPKAAEAPVNPLEISVGDQLRGRVKTGTATWADVALSQSVAARIDVDALSDLNRRPAANRFVEQPVDRGLRDGPPVEDVVTEAAQKCAL